MSKSITTRRSSRVEKKKALTSLRLHLKTQAQKFQKLSQKENYRQKKKP